MYAVQHLSKGNIKVWTFSGLFFFSPDPGPKKEKLENSQSNIHTRTHTRSLMIVCVCVAAASSKGCYQDEVEAGTVEKKEEKKNKSDGMNKILVAASVFFFFFLSGADPLPHPSAFTGSFFFCSHKHKHTHTTKKKKDSTFFLFLFFSVSTRTTFVALNRTHTYIKKKKMDNPPETRGFRRVFCHILHKLQLLFFNDNEELSRRRGQRKRLEAKCVLLWSDLTPASINLPARLPRLVAGFMS